MSRSLLHLNLLSLIFILSLIIFSGSGAPFSPAMPPLSFDKNQYENSNGTEKVITIGVLANRGYEIALKEWGPTASYLSKTLAPAEFTIRPLHFNETTAAVMNREVAFICANPSVYTALEYHGLAQRIATLQVPGDPYPQAVFGGVIITRAQRDDIRNLSDLKGKSFAAVDPTSLGGWHASWAEFLSEGINPEKDFSSLIFTGTHDAAVLAVLNGSVDGATARSTQLERMAKEGTINLSEITVLNNQHSLYPTYPYLLSTRLYPEWPFAAVTGTDPELSKKVSIALLMMDEKDPAAIAVRGAGWAIPQDHTTVHELLRLLHLPPYEQYGKPTIAEVINQYWQSILFVIIGIIILSLLLLYTWRTKKYLADALIQVRKSEQAVRTSKESLEIVNAQLAETQQRIMDSIEYAKLIQHSILPSSGEMEISLKDHFTLFKPLELVGGDFYLLKKTKDGFCIALADCTGHGVPGAFMTMMANALLCRVIETNPYDSPARLLEILHGLVQETLKSQSESRHLENGLDIALCRVYPEEQKLIFAGGGLPLVISHEGSITTIPGDRIHLGFSQTHRPIRFTDHQIDLQENAQYYLITDGVLDLPGGMSGYGLSRKHLEIILLNISHLPMDRQKEELLRQLILYQGDFSQKDDMTIIGFTTG